MKKQGDKTEAQYFCKACRVWKPESDFDTDEYECNDCLNKEQ
jgi:hypothetical protein